MIVYDAINSPVFRKDEKVMILPSDNAAIAIEVKSNLTKLELKDAVEKIKIVKKLKKTPISKVDQQITFSEIAIHVTTKIIIFTKGIKTSSIHHNGFPANLNINKMFKIGIQAHQASPAPVFCAIFIKQTAL